MLHVCAVNTGYRHDRLSYTKWPVTEHTSTFGQNGRHVRCSRLYRRVVSQQSVCRDCPHPLLLSDDIEARSGLFHSWLTSHPFPIRIFTSGRRDHVMAI